jgi:hypothetical protein
MKKPKITAKLSLGKETIAKLTHEQAASIIGGDKKTLSWDTSCSNVGTIQSVCLGSTCAA